MSQPFEYYDENPMPKMSFYNDDISASLGQVHGMLGSFLSMANGGGGAGGGGGFGGGVYNSG